MSQTLQESMTMDEANTAAGQQPSGQKLAQLPMMNNRPAGLQTMNEQQLSPFRDNLLNNERSHMQNDYYNIN